MIDRTERLGSSQTYIWNSISSHTTKYQGITMVFWTRMQHKISLHAIVSAYKYLFLYVWVMLEPYRDPSKDKHNEH